MGIRYIKGQKYDKRHLLEFEFKQILTWNQVHFISIIDKLLTEQQPTSSWNENLFNLKHFFSFLFKSQTFISNPTVSDTEEVKLHICSAYSCLCILPHSEFMPLLQYCFIISLNEVLINHLCFPVKWSRKWFSHYWINLVIKERKYLILSFEPQLLMGWYRICNVHQKVDSVSF